MALISDQFSIIQNNKQIALTQKGVNPRTRAEVLRRHFGRECGVGSLIWWLSEWEGSIFFWKVKLFNFKYLILSLFIANAKLRSITKYTLNVLKSAWKWVTLPQAVSISQLQGHDAETARWLRQTRVTSRHFKKQQQMFYIF